MKPLTRAQVKSLNALARPKDCLERLWAEWADDSYRNEVVKVTATRVYFSHDHDGWYEPISKIKSFRVLTFVTVLTDPS